MKIGKAEASQGTSRSLKLLGKLVPLGTRGQSRGSLKELGSAMQTDPAGSETHTSCFFDGAFIGTSARCIFFNFLFLAGAGADFVMLGGMLAGHSESGGELIERDGKKYKLFYGMSSEMAMKKYSGGVAEYRYVWKAST
jgi:IMP dehydrogenase/GMP reductase